MDTSTIAAIATPGGRGGIGIIKISGLKAEFIAKEIFFSGGTDSLFQRGKIESTKNTTFVDFQSHRLQYGHIIDPLTRKVVDEVLLCVMKAPRTYTKEDVVEINAHGGPAAVNAILELVLRKGARLAGPGEFTQRAFINGRIDLTQAEAVVDIISARTDKALQMAAALIDGELRKSVEQIRKFLIGFLSLTEAAIDFPDDVGEIVDPKTSAMEIEKNVVQPLRTLIRHYVEGNVLRDGLRVAVIGRPNVGKSSLLNQLVQKERAIVTVVPGTTRDAIEESLNINGFPVILTDTAGLHDTKDPIETLGIEKTIENINGADLVLFMVEADCALKVDDHKIFEKIQSKPFIIVINKIDLVNGKETVKLPDSWAKRDFVQISALYNRGIERLKDQIIETAFDSNPIDVTEAIVPNLRQKMHLEDSLKEVKAVNHELGNGAPMELIAIHLQDAIDSLGQVLGTNVKVDVLDRIFSRFCIGK